MARPLWAEQRPENWWEAAQNAIRGVLHDGKIKGQEITGVGLTGQMHGLVLLDARYRVIRPALIWCDQRSQKQVDDVHSRLGLDTVVAAIANPVLTGFTLPKLLWVRDQEPAAFERARKVLLPKDYVRFQLTGELASDVSDASGTALFDVAHRRWSRTMLEGLDLDKGLFPDVVESPERTGAISARAAELTGLQPGTPLVGGAGDQAASAVGNGIVEAGIVSCTIGTSGVVFAHLEHPSYDPAGRVHTFCHAAPGKWHVMGVTQGAGLSLQWLRNRLAPANSYDELTAEAARAPLGCDGLFWLPYLMGERTPHLDAAARGGWVGLTAKHGRAELVRSVLEGVSYSLKDCLEIVESLGTAVRAIRASGGGARSAFWRRMLADTFQRPVATLETQEGSAYGAALLAMVGTRHFGTVNEACSAVIREVSRTEPDPETAAAYARRYPVYRSLYPALRETFAAIGIAER
jgi:xylulokinase